MTCAASFWMACSLCSRCSGVGRECTGCRCTPRWVEKILTGKSLTSWPNICIIRISFSHFLKNFSLARLHSIKFLFSILEIWACNVTSKSKYIFYIFGFVITDSQLPKCTKHMQNCTNIVCGWEFARPSICTHNVLSAETLPRWGPLQRFPRSTV